MPVNREDFERMKARHKAIPKAVMEAIQPTLRKAAADIVAEMQRECPVSKDSAHGNPPGALRDSITAHARRPDDARSFSAGRHDNGGRLTPC